MKTKMILMLIMSISTSMVYGQVKDFKLADYKYADLKRITLTTDFDLNSDFLKSSERQINFSGREKANRSGFSGKGSFRYFINNRKWQRFISASLFGNFNNERTTFQSQSERLSNQGNSNLNFEFDNRRYFNKNFFLEGNVDVEGNFRSFYVEALTVEDDWSSRNSDALIELGAGKGRIEFVQSAQTAQFIFRDLQKAGILNRALTAEDVTTLADHISLVLNERFFDFRRKRIYQIKQLDSLLVATDILRQSDAVAATLIYDNLLYAQYNVRHSGSRISAGFSGGYDHNYSKGMSSIFNSFDFESGRLGLGGYVNYIWEKPSSLYWQHTVTAGLEYTSYSSDEFQNTNFILEDFNDGKFDVSYKLGFYPNTRTYLAAAVRVGAYYTSGFVNTVLGEKETTPIADFSMESYYFISPRLRLFVNYKLGNTNFFNYNFGRVIANEILPDLNFDLKSSFDLGVNFAIF